MDNKEFNFRDFVEAVQEYDLNKETFGVVAAHAL